MLKRIVPSVAAAAVAASLGVMVCTDMAHAQATTLEEVVVTARKRTENLQDVTTAISALSTADLKKRFDTDLRTFGNAAPNVIIDDLQQGPGSPAAISIRGVGSTDVEKSFDPTAGVVLDGIFIGANSGAMIKALDLQSVEVLRGPQGTLFGRNSIAGVINVTRTKPSDTFAGEVRGGFGNYSDFQADGYVTGPLSDTFFVKLAAAKRQRDGYAFDSTLSRRVGDQDFKSVSPSFRWLPSKDFEINYRYDWNRQSQDPDTVQNLGQPDQAFCFFYNQCAQSVTSPQSGDRYRVLQNDVPKDSAYFNSDLHTFSAGWNVHPGYRLDYLFGYFKTDEAVRQDWDGTPLTLYHTDRPATYSQRSHELRLTSTGDGPLTYTVGVYSWNSNYHIDLLSFIGFLDLLTGDPAFAGFVLPVPQSVQQKTESRAAFFEGDYAFGNGWTVTLGGRYTHDKKTSGLADPTMPELATLGNFSNPFEASWSEFTPKASLKYKINPDLMVYGLYSRGFRAGGFSGRPGTYDAASTAYNPEKVDNFELGWKSEWLNRRVRLNGAIFLMKYKEKQEEQSYACAACATGQQTLIVNAGAADIKGLEIDFAAFPGAGFSITGNVGFLDAKYTSLKDPIDGTDLTYLKLRRAPRFTGTLSPSYEWSLPIGLAAVQLDYHFIGAEELTFFNSPQTHNSTQSIVDLSLNLVHNKTRFSVYGMNLTQEDAWTQGFDVGATRSGGGLWSYTTLHAPRTYGLRVTQSF